MNYSLIRNKIEQKGFTYKFFLEQIGMTRQGFEPAIINETVSAKVLMKMSEVLDVPVSYFFDEGEPVSSSKESEIIELQRKYIVLLEAQLEAERKLDKKVG